jgi:hypothetical protein
MLQFPSGCSQPFASGRSRIDSPTIENLPPGLWAAIVRQLERLGPITGPDGGGNYRIHCIDHRHPDRHPSMDVHPERGFICRSCGRKGSLLAFAHALGIPRRQTGRSV